MNKVKQPGYSGMFVEPDAIRYQEIDEPLRKLIELINAQPWVKSYGCCAGQAHHGKDVGLAHQFFIGLFLNETIDSTARLRLWLEESNRLNGPTGLVAEMTSVHKHPFGQGNVDGWGAYRITAHQARGGTVPVRSQIYLRLINCLETAWEKTICQGNVGRF